MQLVRASVRNRKRLCSGKLPSLGFLGALCCVERKVFGSLDSDSINLERDRVLEVLVARPASEQALKIGNAVCCRRPNIIWEAAHQLASGDEESLQIRLLAFAMLAGTSECQNTRQVDQRFDVLPTVINDGI